MPTSRPSITALSILILACGKSGGGGPIEPPPSAETGIIQARVHDDLDAPVGNVSVELQHGTTSLVGVTGETGVVTFADVPVGAATVSVVVPDAYRTTSATLAVTVVEDTTLAADFRLTLKAGSLFVTVSDSTGGFIPDVRVAVSSDPERTAITDPTGKAAFQRIRPGSYTVTVAGQALGSFQASTAVAIGDNTATAATLLTPIPRGGAWHEATSLPAGRASTAAVRHDDAIYVVGGSGLGGPDVDVLKFDGSAWTVETVLPQGLNAPAAAVIGDELFVIGGFAGTGNTPSADLSIYNFTSKTWSAGAALPTPRGGIQAAVMDGRIHVVGGGNASSTLAAHEAYDPTTDSWLSLPDLPAARGNPALAVLDGKLYAIGGASGGAVSSDVDVFDPVAGTWTEGPALPVGRVAARAVAYRGALYVFGGEVTFSGALDDVRRLNTTDNGWERATRMPIGRSYAAAALLDDSVYLIGGSVADVTQHNTPGITSVVRYFVPDASAP